MSKFTLVLDSSQISQFLECPTAWNYGAQELLGLPIKTNREAMNAGTYGHKILEVYYIAKTEGLTLSQRIDKSFTVKLEDCAKPGEEPPELSMDMQIAVKNRLREYYYTYSVNDFEPVSAAGVEVGFSKVLHEDNEDLFVVEGRIDLLASLQGLDTIADHKFQLTEKSLYQKSVQFRTYTWAAEKNMLIINYIRLHKNVTKTTLQRVPCCFTSLERKWWEGQLLRVFRRVKSMVQSGTYEQHWNACSGKFNYPCIFTPLCEEFNADMRELKKRDRYVKVEKWHPW